ILRMRFCPCTSTSGLVALKELDCDPAKHEAVMPAAPATLCDGTTRVATEPAPGAEPTGRAPPAPTADRPAGAGGGGGAAGAASDRRQGPPGQTPSRPVARGAGARAAAGRRAGHRQVAPAPGG